MCLYPRLIKNPKYKSNKKNGGLIPAVSDIRTLYVPVACGNCIQCRKQYARSWNIRLQEDIKINRNAKFITLTFSNESIKELSKDLKTTGYDKDNEIATIAVRRFLERHRKIYKTSLRHWLVTELGHNGTENIHLHGIIWTNEKLDIIEKIWQYGYMWKGKENTKNELTNYVSLRTINYITKYVTKIDIQHSQYKAIILTSPGIGRNYITSGKYQQNLYKNDKTNETYRLENGKIINLPVYYRNNIYSDYEKEQLWLNKLNKNERYINGQKYKTETKQDMEKYFQALQYAQQKNKSLGYGDDSKNWEKKEYEEQLRELNYKRRTNRK